MTALMEVLNEGYFASNCLTDAEAVFWYYIPVVKGVCHEHGAFNISGEFEKITFCPESVVVAGASVLILGKLTVSIELVAHGSSCWVSAVNEIIEGVDIFSKPTARMAH